MLAALFDILVPPRCAGCGCVAAALCSRCIAQIARPPPIVRRGAGLIRLIVGLGAFEGTLRRAILALKYSNAAAIGATLGELLARHADREGVLVPVPLHASRLHARGYNQAETLARGVLLALQRENGSKATFVPDALMRVRATAAQSGLDHDARQRNVRAAFAPGPGAALVRGRRVVLVDDVLTTGATLNACAAQLLDAGAAVVDALSAAVKV